MTRGFRYVTGIAPILACFWLAGCGGAPESPAEAVSAYVKALGDGDLEAARELLCAEAKDDSVAEDDLAFLESYDVKLSSIGETKQNEPGRAKVKINLASNMGPDSETVTVVDEDGWKVCEGVLA